MKYTFSTLALAALSVAAPASHRPSSFSIKNVISGGSGCPQGSIDIDWTDSSVLPIYFNKEFTARVGSSSPPESSRKFCQINLSLDVSPGFSFAIYHADYTGWADLDSGITGVVKSTYYFSGSQDQTSSALAINGPFHGRYYKQDSVPAAVWSPCGGNVLFNVHAEVALTPINTNGYGILRAQTEAGRFGSNLYVQWRKC
ncbi:hypothetical protein BDW02DRAFT_495365 [Decorospora gaudefroyi]|uniref:Secreted protein n=1 Tax=Decorospora gaudefroyi TaxID=184978 RepID=A0A6A5KIM6_9PLEO|nr:hypothetical protein BDW02DRAFT_495365 [Decorospora gaudefroyi]